MKIVIKNSYSIIEGFVPEPVSELLRTVLTYKNDIDAEVAQIFFQMKRAKRAGDRKLHYLLVSRLNKLKATEWVCRFKDNTFPTGLLNMVKETLKVSNQEYEEVDLRVVPKNQLIMKWVNRPFEPRYYQKEMIDIGIKAGRGVFEASVGSGKSLVLAYILKELSVNSLIIVPSVALGGQLENDFKIWFGKDKVETVNTKGIRSGKALKPIRIATIQTIASLQKTDEVGRLVEDLGAVFMDEAHHSASDSYINLLSAIDHVYYRFGFTGTFLRNDSRTLDLWAFLSNILYRYPAKRAIEEGFLTPIKVQVYDILGKNSMSYPKEYDKNYCGNQELLVKVRDICKNAKSDDQILILVKNKDKAGAIFNQYLEAYGIQNAYISGDDSKEVINSTINDFNNKKVRVLIGSSVIGEGIDVRSTDHLIMCQGGKSEIVIVQAVGRAVRLFEGKPLATIHDFNFLGTRYMRKHLALRAEIYQRNFDCPITRVEIS